MEIRETLRKNSRQHTQEEIYLLLSRLGITANYTGFFYTAHAVRLIAEQPQKLLLVTKQLYPEVAEYYGTSWVSVERNIRTAASVAWEANPALLTQLAGYRLTTKPRTAQFLAILASHCSTAATAV